MRIKYKGYLQKTIRKTRNTKKQNTFIICKKTLDITFLYTLRQISKSKKNKKNQQKGNKS
jgi:hypothetical protein